MRRGQSLGGVGDPREPPSRARGRQVPDGNVVAATLNAQRPPIRPGGRGTSSRGAIFVGAGGRGRRRAGAAASVSAPSGLLARCAAFAWGCFGCARTRSEAVGVVVGVVVAVRAAGAVSAGAEAVAGCCAPGSAVTTLLRGQEKSSARPVGALSGSPLVSTRTATGSVVAGCGALPPPSNWSLLLRGSGQRYHRAGNWTRRSARPRARCGARRRRRHCRFRRRHRDRNATVGDIALDLALDVMRELAGAGLGEIDAVAGSQTADLTFEIGALNCCSGRHRRRSRPRRRHRRCRPSRRAGDRAR